MILSKLKAALIPSTSDDRIGMGADAHEVDGESLKMLVKLILGIDLYGGSFPEQLMKSGVGL